MDKKKIVEQVSELALPICEACGVELVDVEYVRERDWYLRVYIDKEGGIDIDDCTAVSGDLEKVLDEKDVIKEQYYLEVSSPGIDRPLKKDSDYVDHYGKKIDVSFYAPFEGKKVQTYELVSHDEAHLVVKNFKKQKSDPGAVAYFICQTTFGFLREDFTSECGFCKSHCAAGQGEAYFSGRTVQCGGRGAHHSL